MRTLCALLLVTLARAEVTFYATKCCGAFEMLAGDGQSCVVAPWPRNYTLELQQRSDLTAIELRPGVLPWVRHWMPPGLSLERKADAYLSYLPRLHAKSSVRAVAEATQWDERRAEAEGAAYWRRRVVFTKYGGAVRRESFHAVTATVRSFACCVDAARPPLAPFALVVEKDCDVDECASKCCEEGKVAEAKGEGWKCREDARGNWSPDTSSFARFLPADLPLERSKLQMARPGSGDRWRFVGLSVFAWGLPALMLGLCSHAFESDAKSQKWFSPSLMETRTCFNELAYTKLKNIYSLADPSIKPGTALFYYGPVCSLVVVNVICIARTLKKVQFLRRGNSVLHRDDDKVRLTEAGVPRADNARNRDGVRSAVADAKTIRLYVKMLLMTGLIEMFAETLAWITKIYSEREQFSFEDHALSYRATGFVADCFRAGCVAWLAAPEGGYFSALRRCLGGGGRGGARKKRAFS